MNVRDLIITRGHAIVLAEPGAGPRQRRQPVIAVPANLPQYLQFVAFSRAPDQSGKESGLMEYKLPINLNSPILRWQPVDGGFYYLSGDQKLHFMRGAAQADADKVRG